MFLKFWKKSCVFFVSATLTFNQHLFSFHVWNDGFIGKSEYVFKQSFCSKFFIFIFVYRDVFSELLFNSNSVSETYFCIFYKVMNKIYKDRRKK